MDSWWFLGFLICGCYAVGDGVGSIILYWNQMLLEHLPRLTRAGIGAFIVLGTFLLFNSSQLVLMPICIVVSALAGAFLGWTRRTF